DGLASVSHKGAGHKFKAYGWVGQSKNDFARLESVADAMRAKDFFNILYKRRLGGMGLTYHNFVSSNASWYFGASYSEAHTTRNQTGQIPGFTEVMDHHILDERVVNLQGEYQLAINNGLSGTAGLHYTDRQYRPVQDSRVPVAGELL